MRLQNDTVYAASPGGLVVDIWCSHHHGLGSFPTQGTIPPSVGCHTVVSACCCDAESYATGISNTSRLIHGPKSSIHFSGASSLRKTRKKDLATHFQKIGHENPMNSSRALSDRQGKKTGQGSALLYTGSQGVGLDSMALTTTCVKK